MAAAEPPRGGRASSTTQITSETPAEPLTEGVKAFRCQIRSGAACLGGSWNRLTPSASLGSIRFDCSWVVELLDPLRLAALGTSP